MCWSLALPRRPYWRRKLGRFVPNYPDVVLDVTTDDSHVDLVAAGNDAGIQFGECIAQDMVAVRVSPDHAVDTGQSIHLTTHDTLMRQFAPPLRVSSNRVPTRSALKEDEMMGRTLTLLILIGLTGTPRNAVAAPEGSIAVLVYVTNQAQIPPNVLTPALTEATRIYSGIGVRLLWTESSAAEYHFTVRIISTPLGGGRVTDFHALGAAPGTKETHGKLVYAYYGPIERLARRSGTDVVIILGHVIAHELGHLLLPYDAHTMIGVMGSGWDRAQVEGAKMGELTFTRSQGKAIRERLEKER